jgi:hypothetical protein
MAVLGATRPIVLDRERGFSLEPFAQRLVKGRRAD